MKPFQLLLQTETHLATHRRGPVSLVKRMTAVLEHVVPHPHIGQHLQAAASLLAEYRPPDLATICRQYSGILMLEEADRFIRDQYGRRDAAMIISIRLRRAAEGRPYPAISLPTRQQATPDAATAPAASPASPRPA